MENKSIYYSDIHIVDEDYMKDQSQIQKEVNEQKQQEYDRVNLERQIIQQRQAKQQQDLLEKENKERMGSL